MEKCHIPYASVMRTSRVQAWISKSLFEVSEQGLGEGRAWVESRWFGNPLLCLSWPDSNMVLAMPSNEKDHLNDDCSPSSAPVDQERTVVYPDVHRNHPFGSGAVA